MFHLREGSEKLRELEEIMGGSGTFSENFTLGLGDLLEIEDDQETQVPEARAGGNGGRGVAKKKADPFPAIDGEETAEAYVDKYKKACLSRRGVFRDLVNKWEEAQIKGGKSLSCFDF